MKSFFYLPLGVAVFAVVGCNMTDDPRQGGLFSYSSDKYERRIQDREARLASIEAEQAAEERENSRLFRDLATRQKEVAKLKANLNAEQKKIDQQLNLLKKDKAKTEQASLLARKNDAIRKESTRVEKLEDTEAKKREIQRLRQQLDELKMEADALSRL